MVCLVWYCMFSTSVFSFQGPDGTEFIFIPMDTDNLQKLLQNIDTFQ